MSSEQTEASTSQARLAPIVGPASFGLAVMDGDLKIRSANQAFLARAGVSAEQVTGMPLASFFGTDTDPACVHELNEAVHCRRECSGKVRFKGPEGADFSAELSIIPVCEGGQLQHYVTVLRDLHDTDEAQALLDATSRRFQGLLEHLPAGVVVHGNDSRILAVNARGAALLGASQSDLVKRSACDDWYLLREDGTRMAPHEYPVCRTLEERRNLSDLVVGIDRGGGAEPGWLLCNTYLVCEDGSELSEVVACFTDCTKLKRTEQALHKSEERLRLVLQGSTDAPWDWNLRTGELYYSPRWWEMVGRVPGELPEDAALWLRLAHPDDAPRVRAEFDQALASTGSSYEIEFRLQHKDGHHVPVLSRAVILRDQQGRPLRVSGTNTDLTERKQAEHNIHQLAYFDFLTGLPNRRFLMDELQRLLSRSARSGQLGALLFLDLDNFKMLNDTLGHETGDLLLRQVAYRLRHAVRDSDCVARLGGDEFVLLLDCLGKNRQAAANEAGMVAGKVLAACDEAYALPAGAYRSTPSIGIAMFDARSASADVVLRQADLAMYQAKAAGRNTLRFFDPAMQSSIDRRYSMEHDLRQGIQRNEFRLYCQPQFDAAGELAGGEVLLRWQRAGHGLVGPSEFIGLAETTGLVRSLGQWVLRETCARLAAWSGHPRLGTVTLAVNVSAQQLHMPDFPSQVLATLRETGADPARLGLELTESVLAENLDDAIAKMERLERDGVRFSIDDFGTGYSSLSYLKRFPLETLKIDRSFVHDIHTDPDAAAIVEVIITLARKLGLKVTAEGVEQEEQRQFLEAGGCDRFQGFLFGQPLAMDEFERVFSA
ncbi:EAL domain-containing protein [Massilia solisilvae]|uniref:EAL domain-containing protein n=1 Tax=Massilia solisilvae TaxID=1811225 RepID=A0ABT2BQA4_9BURK|nr:EAL domain-containing protein [Massilia solisilvae]MCS0610691.1 EAL domain-containing protein [Massilia solisilvae]